MQPREPLPYTDEDWKYLAGYVWNLVLYAVCHAGIRACFVRVCESRNSFGVSELRESETVMRVQGV